jgi:AraC-like DNA-binding protein
MTPFAYGKTKPYLYEAIYGGPPPARQELRACIRENRIAFPCQVLAIQHRASEKFLKSRQSLKGLHNFAQLHIHPGLVYLSFQGDSDALLKMLKARKVLFGDPWTCPGPSGLVRAIRETVVSLRRRELKPLIARHGASPALVEEIGARNHALQVIKNGEAHDAALRRWIEIVQVRNLRNLNTIRRRMTEFLCQLTRDVDTRNEFAHPFAAAITKIFSTFAYSELIAVCEEIITAFKPRFATVRRSLVPDATTFSPAVQAAIQVMQKRSAEPISLTDVAAEVHASAPYLSRIFRREAGRTLTDYLQGLRIDAARKMLAENDTGTLQIALACGFNSPEHFFRTFRKLVGMTPRAWQRAHSI